MNALIQRTLKILCVLHGMHAVLVASTTKLNPPLVEGGDITTYRITTDQSRIVYRADQDVDEVFELYSIPFQGGPSTRISGPLVAGGNVEPFYQILPNNDRVLYFADQDTDDVLELYSAPIDGRSPPIKLNSPFVDGGDVNTFDFEISADGKYAVFLADGDTDGRDEAYSTLTDRSGTATKLNGPLTTDDGAVKSFEISPDGQTVVYRAIQDNQFRDELYSRPIDGSGDPVKMNGPLVRGGDVVFYEIDPTSTYAVFRADQDVDDKFELFSRRLDGSGPINTVNDPLASDESRVSVFQLTPDGSRVVYTAEQDQVDTQDVYVRAIDGSGESLKLSNPLLPGRDAYVEAISEDGSIAVYLSDEETEDVTEAYRAVLDGSRSPLKLNGPLVEDGEVIGGSIYGDRYLYFADAETTSTVEIFSSPIDGGEMVKLNGQLPEGSSASAFTVSNDSQFVVYLEGNIFFGTGIFAVPSVGGTPVRLDELLDGESIEGIVEIAPDNRTVVYRATQDELGVFDLYSARIPYGECDFNENGQLDVGDVDLLITQIRAGDHFFPYDVTGDFRVDIDDLVEFITSPNKLNTYMGDANLDGQFDSGDLVAVFRVGEYEDDEENNSTWAEGDWNADGDFGTGDLVFAFRDGGYERGPRAQPVPEPDVGAVGIGLLLILSWTCRRKEAQLSS